MSTPTPSVHDLCIELARSTSSRVERYLLLRLAITAGRSTSAMDLLSSKAVEAILSGPLAVPLQMVMMKIINSMPSQPPAETTPPAAPPPNN